MGLKLLLNVLYTVGIFVCLYVVYWGYNNKRWDFIFGAVVVAAVLVFLKIKLLKEVRTAQVTPPKK